MIRINGNNNRNYKTYIVLGSLIKFLCERHNVDAVLTESRADRRSRSSFTCRDLKFNVTCDFLSHLFAPPLFVVAAIKRLSERSYSVPPTVAL